MVVVRLETTVIVPVVLSVAEVSQVAVVLTGVEVAVVVQVPVQVPVREPL